MEFRVLSTGGVVVATGTFATVRLAASWARGAAGDAWRLERRVGETWLLCAASMPLGSSPAPAA